jgi:hypothetical protein
METMVGRSRRKPCRRQQFQNRRVACRSSELTPDGSLEIIGHGSSSGPASPKGHRIIAPFPILSLEAVSKVETAVPCVVELDRIDRLRWNGSPACFLLPAPTPRRERRAREFASVARDEREPHTATRQEENKSERITLPQLLLTASLAAVREEGPQADCRLTVLRTTTQRHDQPVVGLLPTPMAYGSSRQFLRKREVQRPSGSACFSPMATEGERSN